jgi:hypothetical protein
VDVGDLIGRPPEARLEDYRGNTGAFIAGTPVEV